MVITKTQKFWLESDFVSELLKQIPAYVFWKDKNSVYLGCNNAFAFSLGLSSPEEIVGKTDYDLPTTKEESDAFRAVDKQVMGFQRPKLDIEETQTLPDGKQITLLTNKVPLLDKQNKVIGILGIYYNISERKKREQELQEAKEKAEIANKAKTEFLENMRHDIRTPLTGIVGFANLIKDESTNKKIRQYADNLVESSNALLEFMNSILEAIRLNSSESLMIRNKFEMKKLLQSVIRINKAKAKEKNIKLELIYDKNIPDYVMGDVKKIHRIVHEFVTNALNFTHKGKVKIIVKMGNKNSTLDHKDIIINFSVEDTGIGIPKDKTNEIFMQFNRLNPSREGIYKGLGLGLTSVKKFVDAMEGELYVESQVGKGTVFTCLLPLKKPLVNDGFGVSEVQNLQPSYQSKTFLSCSQKNHSAEVHQYTSHVKEANSSILLVEDSKIAILAAKLLLESLNCTVDVAENGKSAVTMSKTKKYDFIFMDVGLPDINGCEVTQHIRKFEASFKRHTPIVALTAHVENEDKQNCIQAGMDAAISKPLSKETAIDILNAFIPKRTALQNKEKRKSPKKIRQI